MIRPAGVADAAAIAELHLAAWLGAYRGIMPDEVLDGLDFEARRARWHDDLADGARVLLDEEHGQARGFSGFGPCRDDDRVGAGEVYALNVGPRWGGAGVGEALLAAAVDALRVDGYGRVVLWVLSENGRARRFYEKQGLDFDGTVKPSPWGPLEARYELGSP